MTRLIRAVAVGVFALALSGCMGRNAVTQELRECNLNVTKYRWGREAVYVVLFPVYTYITAPVDSLIVNSIEFWSGRNPISQEAPAIVDVAGAEFEERGVEGVAFAQVRAQQNPIEMLVVYRNGRHELLSAACDGSAARFYRGPELLLELACSNRG
jgi:hypothetical protein